MSGVERIARLIVAALVIGVLPLVAWSGGCSSQLAAPDAGAGGSGGGNGGSAGSGGNGGTTGVGGTTGTGGTTGGVGGAAAGGASGICSNGAGYVYPCGGRGGQSAGGVGGGTGGAAGAGAVGGNNDAGAQCCSISIGAQCSDDRRQLLTCHYVDRSACPISNGYTYGYETLVVDCPNGCMDGNDAGTVGSHCQ